MGAPAAASVEMVKAALGMGGEEVCQEMLADVRGGNRVAAERGARGLKKVAETRRGALYFLRKELFRAAMEAEDVRVRWNLVIALGRLPLKGQERAAVVDWLFERLGDVSGLTRTFALQALWDLSDGDAGMRRRVMGVVRQFAQTGTAAMQARARRLMEGVVGGR